METEGKEPYLEESRIEGNVRIAISILGQICTWTGKHTIGKRLATSLIMDTGVYNRVI